MQSFDFHSIFKPTFDAVSADHPLEVTSEMKPSIVNLFNFKANKSSKLGTTLQTLFFGKYIREMDRNDMINEINTTIHDAAKREFYINILKLFWALGEDKPAYCYDDAIRMLQRIMTAQFGRCHKQDEIKNLVVNKRLDVEAYTTMMDQFQKENEYQERLLQLIRELSRIVDIIGSCITPDSFGELALACLGRAHGLTSNMQNPYRHPEERIWFAQNNILVQLHPFLQDLFIIGLSSNEKPERRVIGGLANYTLHKLGYPLVDYNYLQEKYKEICSKNNRYEMIEELAKFTDYAIHNANQ